jgi:8-oxo-dGTP diphosphatase
LIHRATSSLTQWETPGGKVDPGESPEQAAIREIAEELGIESMILADWGSHDIEGGSVPMTYALFEVRPGGRPHVVESHTFDQLRFFTWAELVGLEDELSPNARNLVSMWWRGKLRPRPHGSADAGLREPNSG